MAAAAHYLTSGGVATAGASPSSAAGNPASWQMAGLPLTAMAFPGKLPAVSAAAPTTAAARPLNSLEVAELRAARERAIKAAEGRRATAVQARRLTRAALAAKEAASADVDVSAVAAAASTTPASLGVVNATATKKSSKTAAATTTTRSTRAAAAKKGGSSSRTASPPSDDTDGDDETPRAASDAAAAAAAPLSLPRAAGAPLPSAVAAATAETARVVGEYHSDEELQRALEATTDEKEAKRLKRLLRNRVSAQQARERKRAYVDGLEGRAIVAERRAAELEASVARLEAEAAMLRKVIQNMRSSV